LNSDNFDIIFTDASGKPVKVKYKILDKNNIELVGKTNINRLKVAMETRNPNVEKPAKKVADFTVRFLMLVRRLQVSYKETSSLTLPGFSHGGMLFGQTMTNDIMTPGLDFSFGVPRKDYIDKAIEHGWLVMNDSVVNPSTYNYSTDFDGKLSLEPIAGLKIELNSKRVTTDQSTVQYMFDGMPTTFNGTFRMTYCALGSAFWGKGNAENNYHSRAFDQLLENRAIVAEKLQQRYVGTVYPTKGFMEGGSLAGKVYDVTNGKYNLNSADVLIPAFMAAYSNRDVNKHSLSLFPDFLSMMPNWTVSYDGLSKIKGVDKYFKSITLRHAYQCTYNVGSYSSFSNYVENEDGLGFVRDVASGNPIPSSAYDIASVNITENLNPLLSVDMAMKNSMTAKLEYKQQRNLTLNIASNQLLEASSSEWVVGVGYILKDFDMVLKLKDNATKKVKNDLTLRLDFSFKDIATLLRKLDSIEDTQATSGNKTLTIKFMAEYVFSSKLNFRFFCDHQTNRPYISTSYPMSNTNVGVSVKFMLTR
jgi:cell surface protein SprA